MKRAPYGSLQRRRILEAIEVVAANFYPVYRSTPPLPSEGKGASVHRLPTVILKTEEDLSRVEVATNRVGVRVKKRD